EVGDEIVVDLVVVDVATNQLPGGKGGAGLWKGLEPLVADVVHPELIPEIEPRKRRVRRRDVSERTTDLLRVVLFVDVEDRIVVAAARGRRGIRRPRKAI